MTSFGIDLDEILKFHNTQNPIQDVCDCMLYIVAHKSDNNIRIINDGKSARIEVTDVDVFKYLYIGITGDFERRMYDHEWCALNPEYKQSAKFYNRIRAHGWDAYEKIVLVTGLTREEACALEIETIKKYRAFELGLNSSPGGEAPPVMPGADNPRAQAVNLYNNVTGQISSFMWLGDADQFLGYMVDECRVAHVVNPNVHNTQLQSKKTGEWFQAHYAYDETSFEKNMPTPGEKRQKNIWIFNIDTKKEYEFDSTVLAATELGIFKGNIQGVLDERSNYFSVLSGEHSGVYDAQRDPKTREWKTSVLSQYEARGLAREKAVIAYDEKGEIVCRHPSIKDAGIAENIPRSNISNCVTHDRPIAGKKDGNKLRWEYEDQMLRAFYDRERPRNTKSANKVV
jgi:predicted GIY-YIG superfamily endonuclease